MHDHDDETLERFLTRNKPAVPPAPADELPRLAARLARPPEAKTGTGAAWLRARPRAQMAAVFLSLALAVLMVLTRQPSVEHHKLEATGGSGDAAAVLADSYGSLDDIADDDGSGLVWYEQGS